MAASNTRECFEDLIGHKVVGILHGACPTNARDIARHCTTLVLDDGTGFTFSHNGTWWQESTEEIKRAVGRKEAELKANQRELEGALAVAGRMQHPTSGDSDHTEYGKAT